MADENDWCFAWMAKKSTEGTDRAALLRGAKWDAGHEITVSFLDDDHNLRGKIKQYAFQWTEQGEPGMANLRFSFRKNTTDTLIRISFKQNGNWSAIGTTCREETDRAKPTMNFGNLNSGSTEEQIRRAVLHEFGHAVGLVHEHQNPSGGIKWNEPAVYRDLMPPRGRWSQKMVFENMFKPYERAETNFTDTDLESVMLYPIPPHWTDGSFTVGWNTKLSDRDKQFIRDQYPKKP